MWLSTPTCIGVVTCLKQSAQGISACCCQQDHACFRHILVEDVCCFPFCALQWSLQMRIYQGSKADGKELQHSRASCASHMPQMASLTPRLRPSELIQGQSRPGINHLPAQHQIPPPPLPPAGFSSGCFTPQKALSRVPAVIGSRQKIEHEHNIHPRGQRWALAMHRPLSHCSSLGSFTPLPRFPHAPAPLPGFRLMLILLQMLAMF